MKKASKGKIVAVLQSGNVLLWNRYVAWCRRFDHEWKANLRLANLREADLSGADLDFASWPLWCGGTGATDDRRLSLQLIYHAFNQQHQEADVLAALEHLRPLAQEFRDKYRDDAPELRKKVQE